MAVQTGTSGPDRLLNTDANDTIDGGGGFDVAVYADSFENYSISASGASVIVTSQFEFEGSGFLVDTLTSIERIEFADAVVDFVPSGNVALAFELFEAALHRIPDFKVLGWYAGLLDGGRSASAVAQGIIDSQEFQHEVLGPLSNQEFVARVYEWVLGRAPDSAGLAYHVAQMDAGVPAGQVFLDFVQSPEHMAQVSFPGEGVAYAPTQVGTAAADRLVPGTAGRIDGQGGIDTVVFTGPRADYEIVSSFTPTPPRIPPSPLSDGLPWYVGIPGGAGHTLVSVERAEFLDGTVAFDVAGHAGQAYRLYEAAFGRTPDKGGLTYQVHALDVGALLSQVAANFLASTEFAAYGPLDDTQFVTQLYHNALHRDPDPAGLAYHVAQLDQGMSRAQVLVGFSDSPECEARLLFPMALGIELYTIFPPPG